MKNKYYLYRHIDNVNNVPFYIGIGTNSKYCHYKRSKDVNRRSNEWKEYVKSINYNYSIEILFETNDYLLINKKEREFVKLYGRVDINTGVLLNKNSGGKGKQELSEISFIKMIKKQKTKKVVVYDKDGNKIGKFDRAQTAADFTDIPYLSVKQCIKKRQKQCRGYRFLHEEEEVDRLEPIEYKKFNKGVPLVCENLVTGEVKIFENMMQASKVLNIPLGTIGNNLAGITKKAKKTYKFNYLSK